MAQRLGCRQTPQPLRTSELEPLRAIVSPPAIHHYWGRGEKKRPRRSRYSSETPTLDTSLQAMPASGNSLFGGALDPDTGMPSAHTFDHEYLFDDELNTEAAGTLFGLDAANPAALGAFDPAGLGGPKALLAAPPGDQGRIADFSPPSHRDSSSSGSSRHSADSSSPKTSHTSGDVMMTESFGDWKDFENLDRHDSNIDMLTGESLDHHADPVSHFVDSNFFDFEHASNSPSPPTTSRGVHICSSNQKPLNNL